MTDITNDFMALALDMKAQSTNKHRQVGAVITNGIASHNTHITRFERPETTLHAEASAICRAAADGRPTAGHEIYVTLSPCVSCAKLIIQAGITAVHYYKFDVGQPIALELLRHAGIKVNGPLEGQ